MKMAAVEKPKKEYDYGNVHISLENCILPDEKLSETPSMKDGLEKATETDLRILGCEFIQTSGILLKLPQVRKAYLRFKAYYLAYFFTSVIHEYTSTIFHTFTSFLRIGCNGYGANFTAKILLFKIFGKTRRGGE